MTENWIPFNLNGWIKVRLTDIGYQRLVDFNNLCGSWAGCVTRTSSYYKDQADENGYTEFQAWDFIRKFGDATVHGGLEYYEMGILVKIY